MSQRATWIATGNNIQLCGDLPRRCYWIRLDARESRPWQRKNFKHPDLLGWVTRNRGRLIHALLTLARAWFAAGKPKAPNSPRLGSFEAWTETVGGMASSATSPPSMTRPTPAVPSGKASCRRGGRSWTRTSPRRSRS